MPRGPRTTLHLYRQQRAQCPPSPAGTSPTGGDHPRYRAPLPCRVVPSLPASGPNLGGASRDRQVIQPTGHGYPKLAHTRNPTLQRLSHVGHSSSSTMLASTNALPHCPYTTKVLTRTAIPPRRVQVRRGHVVPFTSYPKAHSRKSTRFLLSPGVSSKPTPRALLIGSSFSHGRACFAPFDRTLKEPDGKVNCTAQMRRRCESFERGEFATLWNAYNFSFPCRPITPELRGANLAKTMQADIEDGLPMV
jgi:hypothetical protein